jgi:hypothetical protein
MKAKVIITFSKMRDDELDTRAHNIIQKMTDNPDFPAPVPGLADATTALTVFREALEQAQHGGMDRTEVKNAKRLALEEVLSTLGLYVQIHCKNDRSKILGSGFDARKPAGTPIVILEKPNLTVVNGPYPGSFKLSTDKVPGAASYMFEYAAMPVTEAAQWTVHAVKTRIYVIGDLTSGQQYAFRVRGIGMDATPVYSDVITRYAQY